MIRAAWVLLVGLASTLWYSMAVMFNSLLGRLTPCKCERIARNWGRILLWASGSKVELDGLEHYDPEAPHIIVSNHSSWFDVFAVCAFLPGHFRFVAKEELTTIPLFGRAFNQCAHISIDRSDRGRAIESLAEAGARIRDQKLNIVMFAEGTRSDDGALQPFKKGAFVLALESGVPVQPMAILGTRQIMPKGTFRVGSGQVTIRLGPVIPVDGLEHDDREVLRARTHAAVSALLGTQPTERAGVGPKTDPAPTIENKNQA